MPRRALAAALATVAFAAWGEACRVAVPVPEAALVATVRGGGASAPDPGLEEAGALLARGSVDKARHLLESLSGDGARPVVVRQLAQSLLAVALSADGEISASARVAREVFTESRATAPARQRAAIAVNAALALSEAGDLQAARSALAQAAADATMAGDRPLEAIARVDLAMLEARAGADPEPAARGASEAVAAWGDPARRASLYASLGLALLPEGRGESLARRDALADEILARAYRDASAAKAPRDMAIALGLAGELRLVRGESREAIAGLQRALALSRSAGEDPWRYRWLWKLGAAQAAAGDAAGAREALGAAVAELDATRSTRSLGRFSAGSLARNYRGAYLDLADLLLSRGGKDDAATLRAARDVLDRSRASEVEDYFRDPCVTASARRGAGIDSADPSVAVITPVAFRDRTELIVSHRSGLARFTAPVGASALAREVQRLRTAVERPADTRYRQPAQRLDGWLVRPLREHLRGVGARTLVWVPDGSLRGLPFAVLHDGERHLAERYAIAVTPVASAVELRQLKAAERRAVLTGLTESREGFDALPAVAGELETLSGLFRAPVLRDSAFTIAALRTALERAPANVIHVASHGQFAPDASQSFLLAYDGRFTLPQLRQALASAKLREEPVDLLTLSACQTAAGDERAALGLAGVALSAGARSALATLWSVNDESTAVLVTDFYRRLLETGATKAEALQGAQVALMRGREFSHPAFWAPFLLIGNWL